MTPTGAGALLDELPQEEVDRKFEVIAAHYGPTWEENPDWDGVDPWHRYLLPELTLGYQAVDWARQNLLSPDSTELEPKPYLPTPEQFRFILWWYAVNEAGEFVYRTGILQRLKGWGKDPIISVIAAIEFLGPCRVAGWAVKDMPEFGHRPDGELSVRRGDPVAKDNPVAWIQIAAVSRTQPLALNTPVRTTAGWKTMATLQIGDEVFDSKGRPTSVVRDTEVMTDLDCYELTFSDGEKVVASGSHGWTVEQLNGHGDGYITQTLSTADLAATWDVKRTHYRIPLVAAHSADRDDLELDPYMLGLWLGDGATADSTIAIDWRLRDEVAAIIKPYVEDHEDVVWSQVGGVNAGTFRIRTRQYVCPRGHEYEDDFIVQAGNKVCRRCIRIGKAGRAALPKIPTFREKLRAAGVLGDKHVPEKYLFAGTQQRLELLRGLMDSDGSITKVGRAAFTNKNPRLVEAVQELLSSLGMKHNTQPADAGAQRVYFTPQQSVNPFRLAYKAERVRQDSRYLHRHIVGVRQVDSVPVRCIGIDTEDHLFQVGRTGILTHNTKNTMLLFPQLLSAQLRKKAGITKATMHTSIITAYNNTRRIEAVTSNPRTLEGGRPTLTIGNEPHQWVQANKGHDMADVIDRNAVKSKNGASRVLWITNAYEPSEDSVGQRLREAWEAQEAGQAFKTGTLYDSLEAPKGIGLRPPRKPDEPEPDEATVRAWLRAVLIAVRGDSFWLNIRSITDAILNPKNAPSTSRRFYLNQIVADEDASFDPAAILAATSPIARSERQLASIEGRDIIRCGWIVARDDPIVAFFDGSKSDDSTAIVACRVSDGYCFTIGTWNRPLQKERAKLWLAPRQEVDDRVHEMFRRFRVVAFFCDPSHTKDDSGNRYWDSLIDGWHRAYSEQLLVWSIKSGHNAHSTMWDMTSLERQRQFVAAVEMTTSELERKDAYDNFVPEFTHDGDPILMTHMRNSRRAPTDLGVSMRKEGRESLKKIDAAVCLVGARMLRRMVLNAGVEQSDEAAPSVGYAYAI